MIAGSNQYLYAGGGVEVALAAREVAAGIVRITPAVWATPHAVVLLYG